MVAVVAHVRQLLQPAEIDEHLRRGEPELHERQQRVAAGQQLCGVTVFVEQVESVLEGVGADVVERCGNHDRSSGARAAAMAASTML